MSEEEIALHVIDLVKNKIYDEVAFSHFQTKGLNVKLLLDKMDSLDEEAQNRLISILKFEDIINYINENGKNKEAIIKLTSQISNGVIFQTMVSSLKNDSDKTKVAILASVENKFKKSILPTIENSFYRNLIVKQTSEFVYRKKELLAEIEKFEIIRKNFEKFETEEEKAEFITTLNDYDMRLELLANIKSRENRNLVINNFECEIDDELKPQVELVQKMIREYFEDTLQDKFDEQKRERMEIIFNKSNVVFKELGDSTNGRANYLFDNIEISQRHKNNINRQIGFLIHEYEHLFSKYQYKTTASVISQAIEEGTADLLADLVINHYLEKHGKIELNGRKVRIDNPYETYSGYHSENAWQRTILYGLRKSGKDTEALGEYILGDKYKYLELVLGEERAEKKTIDGFGVPNLETNWREIYESPQTDFSEIDNNSIYARRNFILPMYELQNRLKSKGINILARQYSANEVGNIYFDGRKIFEISREEMQEFYNLYMKQINPQNPNNSAIVQFYGFWNSKMNELSEKEIHNYSFEILDTAIGMTSESVELGTDAEKLIDKLIKREIELIGKGQTVEKSIMKYKRIIPDYLKKIKPQKNDANLYTCDYIKDLKFCYIEQIRQALEENKSQEVIDALINQETGDIYLDDDLTEILSEYGVEIRKKRL